MTPERIHKLLTQGESHTIEFKTARRALNRDLYESICAFLNRDGGDILLGVKDDGTVQGVDPECVGQVRRDFANAVHNPQKLNPPCYLTMEELDYNGVLLLHITVPQSSQVHRCNNRIYDRTEDGDYDITDNQTLVTQLYVRKQTTFSENTVYPYATLADLRPDLIQRARKLAGIWQPGHPWLRMTDEELLDSAQLRQHDFQRGVRGLTLAAILLFGKDSTLLSVLPYYRIDAIVRRENVDRYDDRDDIRTNLLDSYDRLLAFGEKHLNDPFYLEGTQRISLRGRIMREIAGNLLIHQEYSNPFPAKLVIERDRLFTENGNRPHGHGRIDPGNFSPYPKNPVIARVFKELGFADELGSGVRKLFKYCKAYCGHDPELVEGDIFRCTLFFSRTTSGDKPDMVHEGHPDTTMVPPEVSGKIPRNVGESGRKRRGKNSGNVGEGSLKTSEKILRAVGEDPRVTIAELAEMFQVTKRSIKRNIRELRSDNLLCRVGPALAELKQSILQKGFAGRLTADYRSEKVEA